MGVFLGHPSAIRPSFMGEGLALEGWAPYIPMVYSKYSCSLT